MKIYVGNLSFQTTEDGVRDLFSEYGNVKSVSWITDRDTGRFRGFAFVEMDDADATSAIEALDGQDFDGRNLRVNEARPQGEGRGGRPRGGGQPRGGRGRRDNFGSGEDRGSRW